MSYSIPIEEKDFLAAMSVAATATGDEEDKKKKLYKELDKIIADKESTGNTTFKKLEYTPPSDEEITEKATNLSDSEFNTALQKYLDSYAKNAEKTAAEKESTLKASESEKENVTENYEASKKASENQALKRGLGRSTVIMNLLQNYDESKNKQLKDIESSLNENIADIDKELTTLEAEKQRTMNNMELEKSVAIAEKISKLKAERDEKVAEVTKFNNDVNEKIIKYGDETSVLSDEEQKTIDLEKAKKVLEYYSGYTAKEAFEDFSADKTLKDYLGDYYSEFYQLLKAKAQNSK